MIRTNPAQGNPARRIAVIQIPRAQTARLGYIRPAPPPVTAWTTISDEPPDSSANWISYILMGQARTRETTPGTLTYTPTSDTPAANVAPWNSWLSPNCPPNGAEADASAAAPATAAPAGAAGLNPFWVGVGIAASLAAFAYSLGKGR